MIAFLLHKVLFRNRTTSMLAGAAALAGILFAWHTIDKNSAVKQAMVRFVAATELAASEAEAEELRRALIAQRAAAVRLQEEIQMAETIAAERAAEIERYELENEINPEGVADDSLLGRMQSN